MALATDLMGLGDSAAHAGRLGHLITTLAGAGTALIGATPIVSSIVIGKPTTGQTAYTLPSTGSVAAKEFYFFNAAVGADSALIYPPGGSATLNGSTSAAVTVAQNKGCLFMCVSGAGGTAPQWCAINSA